ncbi:MAG TPA: NAD(+)/NADH kinase [Steroidobacteraceae bacterium]|nr:NAD(+)/NADH kinase [Steroidobacteraceae bacterium]
MNDSLRTCAVIGNFRDSRVSECANALLPLLLERRLSVLALADTTAPYAPQGAVITDAAEVSARADLLIAVGGDGTLLHAARFAGPRDIPLLGINRGRLGFLADVLPQDMAASLDAVLGNHCERDRRRLLEARLTTSDGRQLAQTALNDVVLSRLETGRMIDFTTRINGVYVNSHSGDGLVVATATGSTAYALSCGGPIVQPGLDVLVVAPISPHSLSDRPILIPARSIVDIELEDRDAGRAQVSCDALVVGELGAGGQLQIRPSERWITLLHPPGYDYFRLLRSKLHWGRGSQVHER